MAGAIVERAVCSALNVLGGEVRLIPRLSDQVLWEKIETVGGETERFREIISPTIMQQM